MRNLLIDQLDSWADVIYGSPKTYGMMEGLDDTFGVVFFVGYHARAGTENAILDHTYSGKVVAHVELNGKPVGEIGLNAALAGYFGGRVDLVVTFLITTRLSMPVVMVGLAVVAYAGVVALTCLAVGPAYGLQQHADYYSFLWNMRQNFPWRGPEAPFLGYNHSISQTVTYLAGLSPMTLRLALGIKTVLLVPLAVLGLRHILNPVGRPGREVPRLALELAFALYLAAFIWLDMVWELSLGIAMFTYLLGWGRLPLVWTHVWVSLLLADF